MEDGPVVENIRKYHETTKGAGEVADVESAEEALKSARDMDPGAEKKKAVEAAEEDLKEKQDALGVGGINYLYEKLGGVEIPPINLKDYKAFVKKSAENMSNTLEQTPKDMSLETTIKELNDVVSKIREKQKTGTPDEQLRDKAIKQYLDIGGDFSTSLMGEVAGEKINDNMTVKQMHDLMKEFFKIWESRLNESMTKNAQDPDIQKTGAKFYETWKFYAGLFSILSTVGSIIAMIVLAGELLGILSNLQEGCYVLDSSATIESKLLSCKNETANKQNPLGIFGTTFNKFDYYQSPSPCTPPCAPASACACQVSPTPPPKSDFCSSPDHKDVPFCNSHCDGGGPNGSLPLCLTGPTKRIVNYEFQNPGPFGFLGPLIKGAVKCATDPSKCLNLSGDFGWIKYLLWIGIGIVVIIIIGYIIKKLKTVPQQAWNVAEQKRARGGKGWANVFNKGNKIDTEAWMTFLTLKQDVFDSVHELSMIKKKWKTQKILFESIAATVIISVFFTLMLKSIAYKDKERKFIKSTIYGPKSGSKSGSKSGPKSGSKSGSKSKSGFLPTNKTIFQI